MNIWAAIVVGLLILIVLMHVAARLWPKQAGYRYLRRALSSRGIMQIPPECIRAFVDDAHDYARLVCAPGSRPREAVGRDPHFEFERMLRVHSFVIHAFLTGAIRNEASGAETEQGELSGLPTAIPDLPAMGTCGADRETLMRELIRSEILRAGVEPFGDGVECQRIEEEVRAGKSWARYRAILCRYELPMSAVTTIGEPSASRNSDLPAVP